uniref:ShKT domain-containing protein n=1 Tax=Lepeophtheirus salmonis TaxID=72036 RepID=A0A0K2TAG5_LEPSM
MMLIYTYFISDPIYRQYTKECKDFFKKNWCVYQKFFLKCYTSRDTQYNCRKTCHFCGPKCKDADIKKCKRMHKSCSNLMISALCKKTCHSCYDDEYNNEYKNKENNDQNNEHKNEENNDQNNEHKNEENNDQNNEHKNEENNDQNNENNNGINNEHKNEENND